MLKTRKAINLTAQNFDSHAGLEAVSKRFARGGPITFSWLYSHLKQVSLTHKKISCAENYRFSILDCFLWGRAGLQGVPKKTPNRVLIFLCSSRVFVSGTFRSGVYSLCTLWFKVVIFQLPSSMARYLWWCLRYCRSYFSTTSLWLTFCGEIWDIPGRFSSFYRRAMCLCST